MKSTICLFEDRAVCEPSLKILLLSLAKHSPEVQVNLFYPPANEKFLSWIRKCPQVLLRTEVKSEGHGWNVKPCVIMRLLAEGFDEVIWLDSDVIVNRNLLDVFAGIGKEVLVATEDALGDERSDKNGLRARLWGLHVGRVLPFGLNTAVLRVTKDHYRLVSRWWDFLQDKTYQTFQKKEWRQRPIHMLGDQDVLTALITSDEFSAIPLHILRRGKDILQFNGVYGYTVAERVGNLLARTPSFIHSFAGKPWADKWQLEPVTELSSYIKGIYLDLSPFTISALRFKEDLECDASWMEPHYRLSRVLRAIGLKNPALVGMPVAIFTDVVRLMKSIRKSDRSTISANQLILDSCKQNAAQTPQEAP
jgi:hypothetical protein